MRRDEFTFFRDDLRDVERTAPASHDQHRTALQTLARFALEEALPKSVMRRLERSDSFVLLVEVPAADWVAPVTQACLTLASFGASFARSGASRTEDRPDRGNDKLATTLASGDRVLGVSQAPERLLPSALVAVADARILLGRPSNAVIARAIQAATGKRPKDLPPRVGAGLSYWEICSSIRGSARECVARLASLATVKSAIDPTVADAPVFSSLVGYGAAHEWGSRLLRDLDAWRRDEIRFHEIDRAVVFGSAPGLGKSTLVRALAKGARLPITISSVATWFTQSNGYLDGVLRQIDGVFEAAAAQAPSILFLDEIDGIPDRATLDGRSREWWTTVINHVLLTLDHVLADRSTNVCIIGATNYADRLDSALVRPGRLNRIIHIWPPTASDLAGIARQHLGEDLADLDLSPFGEVASGATGAQVAGWVKDARTAARAAGRAMRPEDLMGAAAPPDPRPDHEKWRCALHESGHAVGVEVLGTGKVKQVDMVMRADRVGATAIAATNSQMPMKGDLERLVVSLLCGRAAEIAFLGEACGGSGGANDSDLAHATRLLAGLHGSYGLGVGLIYLGTMDEVARGLRHSDGLRSAVEVDLARLQAEAVRLVERHAAAVGRIAERLLAQRVVTGDALREIIAASKPVVDVIEGERA